MRWELHYEGAVWSWRFLPKSRPWAWSFDGARRKWEVGQLVGPLGLLSWRRNDMLIRHTQRTLSLRTP